MPGELKPRRRRRGGRGRGRRRGGVRKTQTENGQAAPDETTAGTPEEAAETEAGAAASAADAEYWPGEEDAPPAPGDDGASEAWQPEPAESAPVAAAGAPAESSEPAPAARPKGRRVRGARGRRTRSEGRGRRSRSKSAEGNGGPEQVAAVESPEAGATTAPAAAEPSGTTDRGPAPSERPHRRAAHGVEKTLVINATPHETRLAILEKGLLAEVFIERESSRTVVGNIYKGRVTKVLPGMQSAFVAIGLERDAFLYVSDISPGYDAYEGLLDLDEVDGGEAIRDAAPKVTREAKIEELIKEGQELLVQVTKEPIGTKGARITSYVTLPGRFLVLMPQVDHVGVSRKIGDARERSRLRRILDSVRVPGMGFIVRTAADGCEAAELEADAVYLMSRWEDIRRKAEKTGAPSELQRELSVVPKIMRDLLNASVSKVHIDNDEAYETAVDLVRRLQPDLAGRILRYRESFPIFEKFGVQTELDKALRSRVWLKSGGYIVINQTEALVAIDVNTGKYVGKRSLEETVLKTNLEAAVEIVRQLRLRDLGGIIVVDFIDMEERKSKKKLFETFEKELLKDRARTKVLQINDFGLVEITRQRTKKSLERLLCRPCPYCSGAGKIKSSPTILFEIQRELCKLAPSLDNRQVIIRANPEVAHQIEADRRQLTEGVEGLKGIDVSVKADATLHHEQFDIMSL